MICDLLIFCKTISSDTRIFWYFSKQWMLWYCDILQNNELWYSHILHFIKQWVEVFWYFAKQWVMIFWYFYIFQNSDLRSFDILQNNKLWYSDILIFFKTVSWNILIVCKTMSSDTRIFSYFAKQWIAMFWYLAK